MSESEMSTVTGQEGIALTLDKWQIDWGDVHINWFENSFSGSPDFSTDDHIAVGEFRMNSPGNWSGYSGVGGISANCQPFDSSGCNSDEGTVFGTLNDPLNIDLTSYNPSSDNEGILAIRWPDDRSHMERVNFRGDLYLEGDASPVGGSYTGSNQYLGRINVVNTLWSGQTQLEISVNPNGGVDLGLDLELEGEGWLRAQNNDNDNNDDGGGYAAGVFGARNYSGNVNPSGGDTNCCDNTQFSGALTWASLEGNRPLRVRFNNDSLDIERKLVDNAPSGTIGVDKLKMSGYNLGTTIADNVKIDYFRFVAP
ncbi:MAG: hypothetical protein ABEK50_06215 [bacterium]